MKEWWRQLSTKEQGMLRWGGSIAGIALLYLVIWEPFVAHVALLRQSAQDNQQLYAWMQTAEQTFKQVRGTQQKQTLHPDQLLATIDRSLKASALANDNPAISQGLNSSVRLQFNRVAFDPLILWIMQLWNQYGIEVAQIALRVDKTEGFVQADITLQVRNK